MHTFTLPKNHISSSEACASDYLALLKPRVMMLVLFTGAIGQVCAPTSGSVLLSFVGLLALVLGAGASASFNMIWDQEIDRLMSRTATRPIPAGRLSVQSATLFGSLIALFSLVLMGLACNLQAALWLLGAMIFYGYIYTCLLKRRTPQNIVIGGLSGALAPVIGWVSATGSSLSLLPWILCGIIFLWTPPHFWALAIVRADDYGKAGIPMFPNVYGTRATVRAMISYFLVMTFVAGLPFVLGLLGSLYGLSVCLLTLFWGRSMNQLRRAPEDSKSAWMVFKDSIVYLFGLFFGILLDRLLEI